MGLLTVRNRGLIRLMSLLVVMTGLVVLSPWGVAGADPVRDPDQLLTRYTSLGRQAEQSSEAMHNAQIDLRNARARSTKADADVASSSASLATLNRRVESLQKRVDVIVRAAYRGARVNRLYAVLVTDSPQSLLDQMSGLEVISRQAAADIRNYRSARSAADAALARARSSQQAAATAVSAVDRSRAGLQARQSDLQLQIAQVRAIYESLTGKQLATLRGPSIDFDRALIPRGTAPAAVAVQAALTRIGDPYVWGGTGPAQFDCSGLMVWAFGQAGRSLPRSSEAQLTGGRPVQRQDLRPGDLVIYYGDASHVGMYVGDGYVVHASTFGVPVKVVPIDQAGPYNSARRY